MSVVFQANTALRNRAQSSHTMCMFRLLTVSRLVLARNTRSLMLGID
jgi:hypothetical protein